MTTSLLLLACLCASPPEAWPTFLGQGHTPLSADSIPVSWSFDDLHGWTASLPGKGQSSPIIWDGRVYVTSIEGSMKDHCHVTALDLTDGSVKWDVTVDASQMVRSNYFQSRSAPTPCADETAVYAFFETGNLLAISHAGEILWQRSLTDDYGPFESTIGLASSPLQYEDKIVLLVDHEGPSYLLAVDKKSGETVWFTKRESRVSYASPALVPVGDHQHIVCSSSGSIEGYDPETGEQLWALADEVGGNRATTPLPCGDGRFVMAASPGMHNENDAEARNTNGIVAVEPTESGFTAHVVWRTEKAMPAFNTPTVTDGVAYWVNRGGVLFCFDAQTGEELYTQRLKQGCWATPVVVGDRLYVFGKDGLTSVVRVGREFELLAENELWNPEEVGDESLSRQRASGGDAVGHRHREPAEAGKSEEPATASEETRPENAPQKGAEPARAASRAAQSEAGGTAEGEQRGGPPARTPEEEERMRQQGENRFADPVQYGVALVNGHIVIRTGEKVYCVRQSTAQH